MPDTPRRRKKPPSPPEQPSLNAAEEENAFRKKVLDRLEGRGGPEGSQLRELETLLARVDERTSVFERFFATKEDLEKIKFRVLVTVFSLIGYVVVRLLVWAVPRFLPASPS